MCHQGQIQMTYTMFIRILLYIDKKIVAVFQMCGYVYSIGAMGASVLCEAWVWAGTDKPVLKRNPQLQCALNCYVHFQDSIAAAQNGRSPCLQQQTWYLLYLVALYQESQLLTGLSQPLNIWTTVIPAIPVSHLCPRAISYSLRRFCECLQMLSLR